MPRGKKNKPNNRKQKRPKVALLNPNLTVVKRKKRAPKRRRIGTFQRLGGNIGSMFGYPRIGKMAGGAIDRIFGSGAYTISTGVRQNTFAGASPPSFQNLGGGTRIRHREYIRDVFSSLAWTTTGFTLQPGLAVLFPWLSTIAPNFEQYRFHGLAIEFKSTSATALNSTNTALGVVGLCTQYDASEPNFASKQEAENYEGCQSANPSQSILHLVECALDQNPLDKLYVRTGAVPSGEDIKFYDLGRLQLFTTGMQAVANIGELWVSYDIEFYKPKLPTGGVEANNQCAMFQYRTIQGTSPLQGEQIFKHDDFGCVISPLGGTPTITLPYVSTPRGKFLIRVDWSWVSGVGAGTMGGITVSNALPFNVFTNGTGVANVVNAFAQTPAGVGALPNGTSLSIAVAFDNSAYNLDTVLTFNGWAFGGTNIVNANIFITMLAADLNVVTELPKELVPVGFEQLPDGTTRLLYENDISETSIIREMTFERA